MGVSLAMFWVAAIMLQYKRKLHPLFAIMGVIANLVASVYLVYRVHADGITIASPYESYIVNAHRALATLTAVAMLVMAYSGITKKFKLHRKLAKPFLIAYTIIYISGYIIFPA